ncbi:MAG: DUF3592 domain-containing protein, partial [Actinomycetota bacterium]|nr:DUF3592 domain-containing protein [Actinomycetota bacterium]
MRVVVWLVLFIAAFVLLAQVGRRRIQARDDHDAAEQRASRTWPTTAGTVVTSDVISRNAGPRDSQWTMYSALVTYRFLVGATEHLGNQIRAGESADVVNRASWDRPEEAA